MSVDDRWSVMRFETDESIKARRMAALEAVQIGTRVEMPDMPGEWSVTKVTRRDDGSLDVEVGQMPEAGE